MNIHWRGCYYDTDVNELEFSEILEKYVFAASFAMLVVSGDWNGILSQIMHVFGGLGKVRFTGWYKWFEIFVVDGTNKNKKVEKLTNEYIYYSEI